MASYRKQVILTGLIAAATAIVLNIVAPRPSHRTVSVDGSTPSAAAAAAVSPVPLG